MTKFFSLLIVIIVLYFINEVVMIRISIKSVYKHNDLALEVLKCARQYLIRLTREFLVILSHFGFFCSEYLVKSSPSSSTLLSFYKNHLHKGLLEYTNFDPISKST